MRCNGRSPSKTLRYEAKMVVLGSIVTGAPFLGPAGHGLGVMDAFGGMAGSGSASLQSLALGVSGALLTTVAGLVVAIPSVFGYNYLLQQTKIAVVELENFASTAADRIELEVPAAAAGVTVLTHLFHSHLLWLVNSIAKTGSMR